MSRIPFNFLLFYFYCFLCMRVLPVCLSAFLRTTCFPGVQGDNEALYGSWESKPDLNH